MKNKILLAIVILSMSFDCRAQSTQAYVGKSKMYIMPNWDGVKYAAEIYDWTGDGSLNTYYFTTIKQYKNGTFYNYSSSHGKYLAFQLFYLVMTGRYDSCEQVMFGTSKAGSGYCAFVIQGNNLLLVDVVTDEVISTLETNFHKGNDFSIVVDDPSTLHDRKTPSFWILNNGYVKVYDGFPSSNQINSLSSNTRYSERIYNLNGVETDIHKNEVFIQDGIKYIAK